MSEQAPPGRAAEPVGVDLTDFAWRVARTAPGAAGDPAALSALDVQWIPAAVPGTAAGALAAAGEWDGVESLDPDASDWWWSVRLPPEFAGVGTLVFDGVATVAEVWVGGRCAAEHDNMFTSFSVPVEIPADGLEVHVVCRALAVLLARRRPRPQWKTRLVRQQNLRWFRTTMLGRMPGSSPVGAPVGPWRPVRLVQTGTGRVLARRIRAGCAGAGGTIDVDVTLALPAMPDAVRVHVRSDQAEAESTGTVELTAVGELPGGEHAVRLRGRLQLAEVERWWPAGYGAQPLYRLKVEVLDRLVDLGRVGFRDLVVDRTDGAFSVTLNGVRVFLPGACWAPPGGVALAAGPEEVRAAVRSAREAGLRLLRVPGTTLYESAAFWDACDEAGLLVWQDVMIANLPPPEDPAFVAGLTDELTEVLDAVSGRPSLAVVCGGSEVEQQGAMLGVPSEQQALSVLTETLPDLLADIAPDVAYVTSSPTGGTPPFRPDVGVAHYFGVGAYLRPLEDARRTGVRFAAECLAFANPPEPVTVDEAFGSAAVAGHTPQWKRGVPRDAAAPWDFEDVRDVYVEMLFGVDVRRVRFTDAERYLDLGRAAVAEAIRRTLAEWRRAASGCGGAVILSLTDLMPGAGWGLRDSRGRPKSAWYAVRQACAPLALQIVDEGMNGLDVHVWNDEPTDVAATVEVTTYAAGETVVGVGSREVVLPARAELRFGVEELLGSFRDVGWAYRFGPPAADVVHAVVRTADGRIVRDVHLPAGLNRDVEPDLGLVAEIVDVHGRAASSAEDRAVVAVTARRFAEFVAFDVPGWIARDAWFHLAPRETRLVVLDRDTSVPARAPRGEVRALNSAARVALRQPVVGPANASGAIVQRATTSAPA